MRKGKGRNNGLLPNSLRIISSCLKTVSTNANSVASSVRSAGASVAASISVSSEHQKDQVLWAGFDKLEFGTSASRNVLLLGYCNGFQVLDVEDASNVTELVSKRDGPVTFLQMQPFPAKSKGDVGFRTSHPLLLVIAGDETNGSCLTKGGSHLGGLMKNGYSEAPLGNSGPSPTAVRFYSLRSHSYVHVLRFRSAVYMVRCSPQIIVVGLAAQIYCFDALTLESKFSVLTYPVPQVGGQGVGGVNIGYGPMAVGPRWLAYASNNPLISSVGRLSPQNLTPSPGVSPSTSPGSGTLVARYAMESSKQLAAGIINLGDMGYKTLSKYCQELLPDGSNSPVSSNSSWKVGRLASMHSTETDNAGMVVVKDFVSRAIISQFRAHSSPISALCFDPSGTLLVTASVHGNNINIFRIMPSSMQHGSGNQTYDWSSSHVHLYKLYRGITTAVIQDICFSNYSQWIAIVSSRGTCHIFVLSPFGGDVGLQTYSSHGEAPILLPGPSLPWWSTSSYMVNQHCSPPPPPTTLSVLSRIKNGNSGWLNTVSNAAASATGKISVPSGAVSATFHNSVSPNHHHVPAKANALEHLLVYTPSGHVVQHELLPSLGVEPCDIETTSGSSTQMQDEDLKVKAVPVQWWDVCRRSDWPEREESISGIKMDSQVVSERVMDNSNYEDEEIKYVMDFKQSVGRKDLIKPHDRPHWYLSNAEVQISSGRMPIWQKSKISFYMMSPLMANERMLSKDCGGEIEVEKIPVHEVDIRHRDLLPVFDHFHSIQTGWNERGFVGGTYPTASPSEPYRIKEKFTEDTVIDSKPSSLGSVVSSDADSSRSTGSLLDLDHMKAYSPIDQTVTKIYREKKGSDLHVSPLLNSSNNGHVSYFSEPSKKGDSHMKNLCSTNCLSSSKCNLVSVGGPITEGASPSDNGLTSEISNPSSMNSASSNDILEAGPALDFEQFFHEGYCKVSEFDECPETNEVIADADSSSSHFERDKLEDDGESDDMLGGVFDFSEEG